MAAPKTRPERTRHPTRWSVEVVRWEFYEHRSAYQRLLAKKREKGPGVQLGQQIAAVEVEDRELAVAIAGHLLTRYAEEAVGTMSLEVHIHPPGRHLEDETVFQVKDEVLEQARELGVEGDIKQQVQRMVRDASIGTIVSVRLGADRGEPTRAPKAADYVILPQPQSFLLDQI